MVDRYVKSLLLVIFRKNWNVFKAVVGSTKLTEFSDVTDYNAL